MDLPKEGPGAESAADNLLGIPILGEGDFIVLMQLSE